MMRRLRRGIAARQGIPPARRRGKMPRKERRGDVLKGSMKNVIVVHPPGGIFSEAVFILRDDYFQTPGISREALLRQARAAAEEYAAAYSPPGGGARLIALVALAVLVTGGAALALRLIGLI